LGQAKSKKIKMGSQSALALKGPRKSNTPAGFGQAKSKKIKVGRQSALASKERGERAAQKQSIIISALRVLEFG